MHVDNSFYVLRINAREEKLFYVQRAVELALEFILDGKRGRQHFAKFMKVNDRERVDRTFDKDVGFERFEFLAHDRALQNL